MPNIENKESIVSSFRNNQGENKRIPIVIFPGQYKEEPRFHNLCYLVRDENNEYRKIVDYNGKSHPDEIVTDLIKKASGQKDNIVTSLNAVFDNAGLWEEVSKKILTLQSISFLMKYSKQYITMFAN